MNVDHDFATHQSEENVILAQRPKSEPTALNFNPAAIMAWSSALTDDGSFEMSVSGADILHD